MMMALSLSGLSARQRRHGIKVSDKWNHYAGKPEDRLLSKE